MQKYFTAFVLYLFCSFLSFSQNNTDFTLLLKSGNQIPISNSASFNPDRETIEIKSFEGKCYLLAQFLETPNDAAKQKLSTELGVEFLDYIPNNAFIISIPSQNAISSLKGYGLRYLEFVSENIKLNQALLFVSDVPAYAKQGSDVIVNISVYSKTEVKKIVAELSQKGLKNIKQRPNANTFTGETAFENIKNIAKIPAVQWIEPGGQKDEINNYAGVATHRDNVLNNSLGRNLRGQNICGGVGDGGFVRPHLDFGTRLININPNTIVSFGDHGDHVSGTVGGAGVINPDNRGMAPECSLVTEQTSAIVWGAPTFYSTYKMVVTNNSYGFAIACPATGTYGSYGTTSRDIDQQLLANPKIMHCFAASNDGGITPCGSYTGGFGTISNGYGNSKNALIVGAASSDDVLAGFSSRGPCGDGRVKPEIVAVGTSVNSTIPTNAYGLKQGTSMATPGVTGSLLLLYQRFRQLNSGQDPDGALIKAVTCNTADDVGNANVDYRHGFGRINMLRAVTALEESRYITNSISQGGTLDYTLTVPAGVSQVRVLLYWADKEASASASPALVNNLNLQLIDPSSVAWNPWTLDPTPAIVNANTVATRGVDNLNNIEQVTLNTPVAGNYTMRITGPSIPFGPQKFYLVYENLSPSVTVTHPFGGELFTPGTTQTIRWDAFGLTTGTFTLQYSTDEGTNWTNITTAQNIANRRFNWTVPAIASDKMRVRVLQVGGAGLSDLSDYNFTVLGTPVPVATVCDRHVYLTWPAVANTSSYEVYRWNGSSFDLAATTSGTSFSFSNLVNGQQYWYAVRGVHSSGYFSRRSTAISGTPSALTACPITNDIGIYAIVAPIDGRESTSNSRTAAESIQVTLKNYGNNNLNLVSVPLNYTLNGGPTQTTFFTGLLNANTLTGTLTFSSPANMASPGSYNFVIWSDLAGDNNASNNAISLTVRQLANSAITLPLAENFESATPATYLNTAFGIPGITRFDFSGNNASSRLRTNFLPAIEGITSTRTITMDRSASGVNVQNSLIYTVNMSGYSTTSSILIDFDYMHHGELNNTWERVWARGTDAQAWVQVYDLFANQGVAGTVNKVRGLDIKSALGAQTIGTSFQIRFGSEPGNTATSTTLNQGYTFDNVRLSEGGNDLALVSVLNPVSSCGASGAQNLTVRVRNNSSAVLSNIPIQYRINNQSVVTASIPGLTPGQTLDFTFPDQITLTGSPTYNISVWVDWAGPSPQADLYKINDSIKNFVVVPTVVSYPYLEGFEAGNSGWITGGTNSTWVATIPTPAKSQIKNAANGSICWVTNAFGNYADNSDSWVESPCFNLTGLSNGMVSFSYASVTEKDWDFVWVEYSANGGAWTKLGTSGQLGSTNWYNRTANNTWHDGQTPWRGVSCPIPAGAVSVSTKFRIRFTSDGSVNQDGVAFDDFHIYSSTAIHSTAGDLFNRTATSNNSGNWVFVNNASGHRIFGFLDNQNLGTVSVNVQVNNGPVRENEGLYYLDRNWVVNSTNGLTSSLPVRFFVRHQEILNLINFSSVVKSFQQLGLHKYSGPIENFDLFDNIAGPGSSLFTKAGTWVPFMDGYYFETSFNSMSEFRFAEAAFTENTPLSLSQIWLSGRKETNGNHVLRYKLDDVESAESLKLQRSFDGHHFDEISEIGISKEGLHTEKITKAEARKLVYYKLVGKEKGGKLLSSNVVMMGNLYEGRITMRPNPAMDQITFSSFSGAEDDFELLMTDVTGKQVYRGVEQMSDGNFQLNLKSLGLPKGLYYIRLRSDSENSTHKLILE